MVTYTDETVLLMASSYLFHRYGDNNSPSERVVRNRHIQQTHKMLCFGSAKVFAARSNKNQLNVQETLGRGLQCWKLTLQYISIYYIGSKSSRSNWTQGPKHNRHTDASVECKISRKFRNNSRCLNRTTNFLKEPKMSVNSAKKFSPLLLKFRSIHICSLN